MRLVSRFHSGNRRSSNKKIIDRIPRSYDEREGERERERRNFHVRPAWKRARNKQWPVEQLLPLLSEPPRDKVGDRYLWVTGYVKANHTCVPPRSITSSITNRDKLPTIFLFNGSYGYIIVSTKRYVASVPGLFLPTSRDREKESVLASPSLYLGVAEHRAGSVKFHLGFIRGDRRRRQSLPRRRTITVLEIFITAGQLMRVGECPRNYRRRGVKLILPGSYI